MPNSARRSFRHWSVTLSPAIAQCKEVAGSNVYKFISFTITDNLHAGIPLFEN
jgi:hypothetical protein